MATVGFYAPIGRFPFGADFAKGSITVSAPFVFYLSATYGRKRKNRTVSRETVRFFKERQLFILALSCCLRLLLALYAGLFVMLSLAEFGKNTRLYALSLKTTKRAVKSFIFFYSDFCHSYIPPFALQRDQNLIISCLLYPKKFFLSRDFIKNAKKREKLYE